MKKKEIKILLAAPRGFCAGVDRAIEIVKKSIKKYGAPVYVRHEIVHNQHVVESLKKIGAIFVEELKEIKDKLALANEWAACENLGTYKHLLCCFLWAHGGLLKASIRRLESTCK